MRSALLVVDVQQGMFMPPTPAFQGEAVVEKIAGLLARARAQNLPVIHVQHDGGPGDVLERGSQGWQIHPGITIAAGEPTIEKRYCSAFQKPISARASLRPASSGSSSRGCRRSSASTRPAAPPWRRD
jgi:nicotinamidase-related amidase